jgi:uncharacterized protein (TIGR00369 family)
MGRRWAMAHRNDEGPAMGQWQTFLQENVEGKPQDVPFVDALKLPRLGGWEPGRIWMRWKVDRGVFHPRGAVFGGYIAALADRALGLVTMSVMADDEAFTTADLSMNFFRPVYGDMLDIEAIVVHRGRSLVQTEATFTRDDGKLACKASASQAIIERRDAAPDDAPE